MVKKPFIFGLGLSRTGTTSLVVALRTLGYRTAHGHRKMSQAINRYMLLNDDSIIQTWYHEQHMQAWVGWPIYAYRAFHRYYPDALWIYNVRDVDAWAASYLIGVRHQDEFLSMGAVAEMVENIRLFERPYPRLADLKKGYKRLRHELPQFFQDHKAKLLVYDICGGDGWGPLCEFLGKEVPDRPFPFLNTRASKTTESVT